MINGDKRTYGKVREISVDQLIRVFRGLAVIEAAVLFGSRTEGGDALPRGRSDYDFAVLLDKRELPSWGPLARGQGCHRQGAADSQTIQLSGCSNPKS